jgi:hypothetical protein
VQQLLQAKRDALACGLVTPRVNLYGLGLNAQAAVESLSGTTGGDAYEMSLGTYAFGLVLVLLLGLAFSYALREKNPDGIPTTPTGTTPAQRSLFGSPVAREPSQATSSGESQNTTTAP